MNIETSALQSLPRVLIIDDIPANVEVLAEALSDLCVVQFANSGPEGLDLFERQPPDLILLDVMMPGMDGYDVLQALQQSPNYRQIPVVFVTAKNDMASEIRALAAGAVDFIHKPIVPPVVRARVSTHLRLRQRDRECAELNQLLEQKVEARTRDLSDALLRAEVAYTAKNNFLANMSHEIRTPLNAVMGISMLLGRDVDGLPRAKDRCEKIQIAAVKLLNQFNDILDSARLAANRLGIEAIDFSLNQVLDNTEANWRNQATGKGLRLTREIDSALPDGLRGDPLRLGQILGNFLDNAIKFSEHGTITLRARLLENRTDQLKVRFEVEDQGIGIAAERQATLFENFTQIDASLSRKYGGAGLGLSICQQLARLMGGDTGFDSTPGQGSIFWATLRLAKAQATASRITTPCPTDAIDWEAAGRMTGYLDQLLQENNIQAQRLGEQSAAQLAVILGGQYADFTRALADFEFNLALQLLRQAVANQPELTA